MGIEPTSSAWKAEVLPLNYTRRLMMTRALQPLSSALHRYPDLKGPSTSADSTAAPPVRVTSGGGGRIRTYEGVSRQIYSLLPLAAWVPLRKNEPRIVITGRQGVNEVGALFAWSPAA